MKDGVLCLMNAWRWIRPYVTKVAGVVILTGCLIQSACANAPTDFQFLSLSDIHFDPFISCYLEKARPCPLIQKLVQAPASAWPAILKTNDTAPPMYGLDTGTPLFTKSLAQAKAAAAENKVAFVWVLGDFIGHDYRKYYRKFSLDKSPAGYESFLNKTFAYVAQSLANTFPNLDVYPVIGNNDTNVRNYQITPSSPFLSNLANTWAPLIRSHSNQAAFKARFPVGGYYSVVPPGLPSVKIIALDSVLFSHRSTRKAADVAANAELVWFANELRSAQLKHQHVLVGMHIPATVDVSFLGSDQPITLFNLWKPQYKKVFLTLLDTYANEIGGIFSGHLHATTFYQLSLPNGVSIPEMGTTSISPIFGNAPGFAVYQFSASTGQAEEGINYDFPLKTEGILRPLTFH